MAYSHSLCISSYKRVSCIVQAKMLLFDIDVLWRRDDHLDDQSEIIDNAGVQSRIQSTRQQMDRHHDTKVE